MGIKEAIRQLIEAIAKSVVDRPQDIHVTVTQGEQTTLYTIRTDKTDIGKILGKHGSMANSIRKIVQAASTKNNFRAAVEIES